MIPRIHRRVYFKAQVWWYSVFVLLPITHMKRQPSSCTAASLHEPFGLQQEKVCYCTLFYFKNAIKKQSNQHASSLKSTDPNEDQMSFFFSWCYTSLSRQILQRFSYFILTCYNSVPVRVSTLPSCQLQRLDDSSISWSKQN